MLNGRSITPAGHYTGVWCRDASFILTELLETGNIESVARWVEWIWQNQIRQGLKVVRGRGSPELGFKLRGASEDDIKGFQGALPSSVQHGYSEVYGKGPDVDSTALMISFTCRFCTIRESFAEKLVPKVREAVNAMVRKDVDGDGLLEQGPNEDWMDSMLRSGKVVYSQAAWAMALDNWRKLLEKLGKGQEAESINQMYKTTIQQVNSKLWNERTCCYEDLPDETIVNRDVKNSDDNRRVTQDISSFLLLEEEKSPRAISALETLKKTLWTDLGPSCMGPPSGNTGPLRLKPYDYQNGGFWPWITSSEIMARQRHGQANECTFLLERTIPYSYLEWVNPHGTGSGSYPFRTGIASTRTALRHILGEQKMTSDSD